MILQIKNIEYFDWHIPNHLVKNISLNDRDALQDLIDRYFIPENYKETEKVSDDYYELEETVKE